MATDQTYTPFYLIQLFVSSSLIIVETETIIRYNTIIVSIEGERAHMNKEEKLTTDFRNLFDKLVWLNKHKMEAILAGYKSSEVHCIEAIEKNTEPNVTKLAESLYMTRGAISKLTKRMIQKKLIESYQNQTNKKEIYFRLTTQGKKVYHTHEELHKEFQERDQVVFEQITDEQFDSMLRFIEKYSDHLDTEIKKQGLTLH